MQINNQAQVNSANLKPAADDKLTAAEIIGNYINAIGGKENLLKVKDRTTVMHGNVANREIKMTVYQKAPDKMRQIIDAGTFMQNIYFNGQKGIMKVGGKRFDVKGSELEKLKYESMLYLLPELDLLGIKLKFAGTEQIDSINAYRIDMILPSGTVWQQYYDKATWLKIMESKKVKTSQGEYTQYTYFGNYEPVEGVKYPFSIKQELGKQKMEFTVTMISVNDKLNDELFKIN